MTLRLVKYHADGVALTGYLADGSGGKRAPGILVAHEASGMNDHVRARAQSLADLGYVAFALDLYGAEFPPDEALSRHMEVMSAPGAIFRRASAALDILTNERSVDRDRLAAIGFCQGGITALELARGGAPIRCAVGFHPGLQRPAGSPVGPISAKVLMMIGEDDPIVPLEDRIAFAAEMNAAAVDWQLLTFGGVGHSYTNPAVDAANLPGFGYDARADRRSWLMMLALFAEEFGGDAAELR